MLVRQRSFCNIVDERITDFFPVFEGGQNLASIVMSTVFLWGYAWLVNRGVENASFVNAIVTFCKLVPLFLFIVVAISTFSIQQFIDNFSSDIILNANGQPIPFSSQVLSCIMVMLWVFVGIEGASVVGSRAKKQSDVGESNDSRDIRLDYYLRLGFHASIWDNDDESAANDQGAACYGLCV